MVQSLIYQAPSQRMLQAARSAPIGVFDSGIGGLSILKALRQTMPAERFVYFADSKHNPYGVKSEEFVRERSLAIVQMLVLEHQIKALVVACNTATAAAIEVLRDLYPELPIIGVEPALKPAAQATRTGRVLVLATRGTLQSEKLTQLKARIEAEHGASTHAVHFTCVPCDGLAEQIEQLAIHGRPWQNTPDLIALCAGYIRDKSLFDLNNTHEKRAFDTLVLGCTHYPLVRELFESLIGQGVMIMDNAQPVAQHTLQRLGGMQAPCDQRGGVLWLSSAEAGQLAQTAGYWGIA
jgi:glutamate racemase